MAKHPDDLMETRSKIKITASDYVIRGIGYVFITLFAIASIFPFLIILLAFMAVGFGMIFSSMTTKYRDLQIMLAKIISLWVYVTPVIYPLSMVTNDKLHLAMSLNPVTPVMEAIKYSLLGQGQFSWLWLGYSAAFTLILLIFGLMLFNKVQKSFMDTV